MFKSLFRCCSAFVVVVVVVLVAFGNTSKPFRPIRREYLDPVLKTTKMRMWSHNSSRSAHGERGYITYSPGVVTGSLGFSMFSHYKVHLKNKSVYQRLRGKLLNFDFLYIQSTKCGCPSPKIRCEPSALCSEPRLHQLRLNDGRRTG